MTTAVVADVASIVRRGLKLRDDAPVSVTEDGALSNINYVYRVEVYGRSLYLKVIPEQPKRLPVKLPRERVFSEAAGLWQFRAFAGGEVLIPEVLFVDRDEFALAMTDVGEGRAVLFNVIRDDFDLLLEAAQPLGRGLGAVHACTRGKASPRPAQEEAIVRRIVFDGLLAPGARQVFAEQWDGIRAEMEAHRECLIHADLWSKNLLVRRGAPVALVDFEGVCCGDPAFDLGTLIAVALLPALQNPALVDAALSFIEQLVNTWTIAVSDAAWVDAVLPRTFRATATFLAARGFGPFAYDMSDDARQRVRALAGDLASDTRDTFDAFQRKVVSHARARL
ncbi:MAG: aminoglycoside phosphotransferase family protein [Acidobacteria bacterium]|nr:aminoglycoside phosphotransferase family protein [Acidobacteriota bacterium]MBV9477687.1 aminoglycoside phosphotransferase family protein [Acidobacteriota bacterium]